MKKIDFGQTITTLANVGVIAGIVFLAVEIQQNNELLAAQARTARHEIRLDAIQAIYNNPELAEVIRKARSGEPLTSTEEFMVERYQRQMLLNWQFVFVEYQNGLLDEQDLIASAWRDAVETFPGLREHWERSKEANFRADFVAFMDRDIVGEISASANGR